MTQTSRIVALLLALQVFCTGFLWTLDALNQVSESVFALFVAVDLVAFAMMSYIYRSARVDSVAGKGWMLVGLVLMLVMMFSSLILI